MKKDLERGHEADSRTERSPRSTRRALLKAGGLLAAAGASAGLASTAVAESTAAPPFATTITPNYFPLTDFVPEISLAGKVAVITGASRGIGLATGLALQAAGVTVIGTSRLPMFYPGHPFPLLKLDIVDAASVDAFAAELLRTLNGRSIDILINNAGRSVMGTPAPIARKLIPQFESQTQLAMETLYVGHVRVTNRLLPWMTQGPYARLLYTVSIAGGVVGGTDLANSYAGHFWSVYYSGKRALHAYANNLRGLLKVSGSPIKVSTVNPTFIKTGIVEKLNPIYLEPVDANGNSQNPPLQAFMDFARSLLAAGLPASFVGQTYTQLLQMNEPLPNVVVGSRVEPYATQSLSALVEQVYLADNAEAALPFGAAGGGRP